MITETLFWLCIAIVVGLCLLSAWDWYRFSRAEQLRRENFRMVDQQRAENLARLADWQKPAVKGLSEDSKRARLEAAAKTGTHQ